MQSQRRTVWRSLKKLKTELAYDPAIPLLGTSMEKTPVWKYTCALMFKASLLTIAKTWNQPKCPLTEEWIKKTWCIYTVKYYSAMKKNERMSLAATWMDLGIMIPSEVSQKEKDLPIWYHLCVESKKWYRWTYFQNRNWLTDRKQTYGYKGEKRRRDKLEIWD